MTLSYDPPSVLNNIIPKRENINQQHIYLPGTDFLIKSGVSLAGYTSYRVGGIAEWVAAPRSIEELQASWQWAHSQQIPITMLGAGSNLLISDRGLSGLSICTRHLRYTKFDPDTGRITAAAGEPIPRITWQAAERGWEGLEWAVGIPGTVGGAVVMNAGAHHSCIAERLVNVKVLLPDGTIETLTPDQLGYAYRTSNLQGGDRLVVEATFQLLPGANPAEVMATTTKHMEHRRTTQPYNLPSCGSVFRNPEPLKAARLIEQTGLKGYQIGGAQISERHANFILNCGGATASDIFQLIHYIKQQVKARWSVDLEPEVKILGEFAPAEGANYLKE